MGGAVFDGARVPGRNLLDCLEGSHTIDEFLEDFPTVKKEQVVALLADTKADIELPVPAPRLFWTNAFPNGSSGNCQGMNPSRFRWQDRETLNGEHLSRIAGQFDAFITLDGNLAHQ